MDGGASRVFGAGVNKGEERGCAYILDGGGPCGVGQRPGSSYCEHHHAVCHIAGGSAGERRRIREEEAIATAVGGKRGRAARMPPEFFLRRLENVARGSSRPKRSRIVRECDR
jgi:hypothetical protein